MQKVLLVNDDGYKAAGLRALYKELEKAYEVTAVAPATEQSWRGKSITGVGELTLELVEYHEFKGYALNGTPADCTQIGLYEVLHEKPTFVVAGINQGANIGHAHTLSSGTVGAALEAGLQDIPAFAVSVWGVKKAHAGKDLNAAESSALFATAAAITASIIEKVMSNGFPADTQVININLPHNVTPDAPWVITRPHRKHYGRIFARDGSVLRNNDYSELSDIDDESTDIAALLKGYVSIVPITIELTSDAGQQALAQILDIPIAGS